MPKPYQHTFEGPETAHSFPLDIPLHGRPPVRFVDGEILTVQYRTDPDCVATLVPTPLVPLGDTVMVQIARWGDVPGAGRNTYEANIMLPVKYVDGAGKETRGAYSPYFFVNSDRTMAGGRELHGQPKRMADVALETRGDLIVGSIARNGIEVFVGTLPYKQKASSFVGVRDRVDLITNINLKIIPHIDGTDAIRQLTARDLHDVVVHGCWSGPCGAEIRANPQAPLYRLPVLEHLEGFYWLADFSLKGGVIIHDYIAERIRSETGGTLPS